MFQVSLTSFGQTLVSELVNIDGIILLYDTVDVATLTSISSYTVQLDEEACGNLKNSVGNVFIRDLSNSQYQAKTILFYKNINNEKKIVAGYSQEAPLVQKTSSILSIYLTLDFSAFINGFLFASIQAGYSTAAHNTDGLLHLENPSIDSDDDYAVYSKSQTDDLLQYKQDTLTAGDGIAITDDVVKTTGIPFGICDNTSTATAFTVTVPGIYKLEDGVCCLVKNGVITSASGFTLNVNGLGGKPCYSNMAAKTRETTAFNVNYTILFIYDSTRVEGGCWIYYRGYYSDANSIGYQIRGNVHTLPTTAKFYRYRLLFTSADGTHFVPSNTSTSTNATALRDVNQTPIDPFGEIVYYSTTAAVEANANPGPTYLWTQYAITFGYSFNRTGAALVLDSFKPLYIKCAPQSDGSAIIDATTPYVQSLPSTNDGKIYIFLGITSSATSVELLNNHPVYYHDGTAIRIWHGKDSYTKDETDSIVSGYVPTSRTVNNKSLSSDVTLTLDDVADGTNRVIPTVNDSTITIKKSASDTGDSFTTNAASGKTINLGLSSVATSGSYNDLSNKPTIPTVNDAKLTIKKNTDDSGTEFTANASSDVTCNLNLADVASSGSYNDLSNTPTIPTDTSDLTNGAGFISTETDPTVPSWAKKQSKPTYTLDEVTDGSTRKLSDYVPTSRKVNNKALTSDIILTLDDVADGTNRLIPTVNNATLTIQKNGATVNTFTANASSNVTANITVPTTVAELTDSSNYAQTSSLSSLVATAQYNSTDKTIEFYNAAGTKLNTDIDATAFIKDGMVDDVEITGGSLVISFNTDAGKEDIEIPISDIFDANNYYTKTQVDNLIPTVNNATLTIQKNGATVNTFTANASSNVTANITVPTTVAELSDSSNYVTTNYLAAVATSGDYDDLINKPTIPTVNNATLTIKRNGTTVDTFTANASSDVTVDITVPTNTNQLTNGAGFITSTALSTYVEKVDPATENAIVRFRNVKGDLKDSGVLIDDHNNVILPTGRDTANADKNPHLDIGQSWLGNISSRDTVLYVGTLARNTYTTRYAFQQTAFKPMTDDSYSLGFTSFRWKYLYLSNSIKNGSYTYSLPSSTGTLALTSDIPTNVSAFTNDAGYLTSYTETDPTVPSWAKEQNKPSYTLDEVSDGTTRKLSDYVPTSRTVNSKALTTDITLTLDDVLDGTNRSIPTDTSDLTNGAGYITGYTETDPTVPSWAKEPNKPTYTASEVGALPDSTVIPTATTARSDSNYLYNGQNVDTLIDNVGISSSNNLLNTSGVTSHIALRANNNNPFLGLKCGSNVWYAQASTNYFYFGPTSSNALRLDQSGNGVFQTGTCTATGFVYKNGNTTGTSTQFLKADGSIDSNTYLTSASLAGYVPTSRTINSQALTSDITLTLDDISDGTNRVIPTTTSQLTNNSGFITSSDLPTNHVTTDTVQTITALKTFTNGIDLGTYHTSASQSLSTQLTVWDDTTNYQGGIEVTGNFNPATEDEYNLGSSNFPWLNVYANSFIKSGGTSAQFLKADGSVDSNTYLTSSDLPTNHVTTDTTQEITGAKTIAENKLKIGSTSSNEDIDNFVFKRGQEFIIGTQTSATSLWKGNTIQDSIYEGMCVNYFVPVACTSTAVTLELTLPDGTTTGAIPVRRNAANTVTNTHIGVGSVVQLTLLLNRTVGSTSYEKVWRMNEWYDSNTNTTGYQLRTNSTVMTVTDTARYYKLYFTSADGEHWVPASVNSTNNATTARAVNQRPINPFGRIVYTSASTSYTTGSNLAATTIWDQYAIVLGYSFNVNGGDLTLTTKTPVYVKCAPQTDGSAIIDSTNPIVQDLPTSADGKIYIFLGIAYDATHIELVINHPVYYHDGTGIRLWTGSNYVTLNTAQTITGSKTFSGDTELLFGNENPKIYGTTYDNELFIESSVDTESQAIGIQYSRIIVSPNYFNITYENDSEGTITPISIQKYESSDGSRIFIDTDYLYLKNGTSIDFEYNYSTASKITRSLRSVIVDNTEVTIPDLNLSTNNSDSRIVFGIGGIYSTVAYFDSNGLTLQSGKVISNGTYTYSLPSATGTLALTSDLPTNYVTTDTDQTISGNKTFTGTLTGTLTGNADSASKLNLLGNNSDEAYPVVFAESVNTSTSSAISKTLYTDSAYNYSLTYNPNTNICYCTTFNGNFELPSTSTIRFFSNATNFYTKITQGQLSSPNRSVISINGFDSSDTIKSSLSIYNGADSDGTSSVLPSLGNWSIGSASGRWKNLYIDNIYIGSSNTSLSNYIANTTVVNATNAINAENVGILGNSTSSNYPLVFTSSVNTSTSSAVNKKLYTDTANSLYYNPSANSLSGLFILPKGDATLSGSTWTVSSPSPNPTTSEDPPNGAIVAVYFPSSNTASSPQLKFGSWNAKPIWRTTSTYVGTSPDLSWNDATYVLFIYSSGWRILNFNNNPTSTASGTASIIPSSTNTYNLGSSSYKWNYLYARYVGSSSYPITSIYGRLNSLYGIAVGSLFFFKLIIKNNSSNNITVPRGVSLANTTYFGSTLLQITSYEERVDDTSSSYGTATFTGTFYTMLRFTVAANSSGATVFVPCLRYS